MKSKRQEREKKLRERTKRQDAHQKLLREQRDYENRYPTFTYINTERSDLRFVDLVREICGKLDFCELPVKVRNWYAEGKRDRDFIRDFYNQGDTHPLVLSYMFHMGEYIYQRLENIKNWLPFNDIRVIPTGQNIHVRFKGLRRASSSGGTIWYSSAKPLIEFNGNQYVVGFSVHALEQTMNRLAARPYSYSGAGDIFSYFDECRYYEPVILNNGDPAFSIWDQCTKGFFSWNYVDMVYGTKANQNNYYRRVGYCPVVFENGFAKAKTLLPPGYRNTPEEKLLYRLGTRERAEMKTLVEKPISEYVNLEKGVFLIPSNYFDAIEFFHRFIPQVRQSDIPYFDHD